MKILEAFLATLFPNREAVRQKSDMAIRALEDAIQDIRHQGQMVLELRMRVLLEERPPGSLEGD